MDPWLFPALFICGAVAVVHLVIARGVRRLGRLERVAPFTGANPPRVSVIVPACNEEHTIAAGLASLLTQDYGNFEILVINDRSTDTTAQVVRALQESGANLRLIEISDLPEGWLGKNHALQLGAELAEGEYLLFTDADVILEPSTIGRAIAHMQKNHLDHLPLIFANQGGTPLLDCLVLEVGLGLLFCFRPWRVKEVESPYFMGVGAFNLIKTSAYRAIGGHRAFAMHPIDDVMLGKLAKERGLHQDCLLALEHVAVPWYATVGEMARGLEKNGFAFFHYRLWLLPPALVVLLLGNVLPQWGALFASGPARALLATAVAIKLIAFAFGLRQRQRSLWYVPGALLTPYLTIYMLLRSVWVVISGGGICWRGRLYKLAELKKSRPFFW